MERLLTAHGFDREDCGFFGPISKRHSPNSTAASLRTGKSSTAIPTSSNKKYEKLPPTTAETERALDGG